VGKKKSTKVQNVRRKATIAVEPQSLSVPKRAILEPGAAVANGLGEALGYPGNNNYFGGSFPGGGVGWPGGGSIQPVEDSTTLFENLRWYLVSNFRQLLSQLFAEVGLVRVITCVPVDDGLRGGITLKSKQLDEEQLKELKNRMDRDGDITTAGWAAKWNRLYGGAGILILVDDQDPEEPLNLKAITQDSKVEYRAVDMWELYWDQQNIEGVNLDMGGEEFEHYNYYAEQIHTTRVMRLKGLEAPSFIRPRLRGWGLSEIEILVRSANQYLKATDLSFEVLDEFKVDYYKIKNLINTLLSPDGTNKVRQRVELANFQKNYQHAVVLDSEDEFDQKQLSFAGLAEVMEGIRMQVAADMRMPITKLFGTSVGKGFQTDQNDMENYNSMVESEVRDKLKYDILRMAEIKCQMLFGMIPDDLELEFKPLRELSATDQEAVKTQKFARIIQAKQAGELTTQEFRDACNKGNLFDIQLDTTGDADTSEGDDQLDDVLAGNGLKDEEADGDDEPAANEPDNETPKPTKNSKRGGEEMNAVIWQPGMTLESMEDKRQDYTIRANDEAKYTELKKQIKEMKEDIEVFGGSSWTSVAEDKRQDYTERLTKVFDELFAKDTIKNRLAKYFNMGVRK